MFFAILSGLFPLNEQVNGNSLFYRHSEVFVDTSHECTVIVSLQVLKEPIKLTNLVQGIFDHSSELGSKMMSKMGNFSHQRSREDISV